MFLRLIFPILVFFTSLPLNAQVALGVNAGITRMKFSGDPPDGIGFFSPRTGFSSSLRFDYRFNDAFALSIQPEYSLLRSKYSILNDSATKVVDSTYFSMPSLSIPVNAIVWSENGRFYVLAGIEIAYVLHFKGEALISPLQTTYNSYNVRKIYLYVQFGAGFIIPLGRPYLSFEFRYSQGLQDLTTGLVHHGSYLPRTKLTNFNFVVGLNIPFGNPDIYKLRKHR